MPAHRLTVDRFGRVVIPKALRDRYGWTAGSDIEISEEADAVRLLASTRTQLPRGLVLRDGRVVYEAPWSISVQGADPARAVIAAMRQARAVRHGVWS